MNYAVRRAASMLLSAVADVSIKLSHEKITEKEAQAEQRKVARKIVARYGLKTMLEALLLYKHTLLDSMKNGKLVVTKEQGDKESTRLIDCYSYGVDEYFRSEWAEEWKQVTEAVKKVREKRAEKAKKEKKK